MKRSIPKQDWVVSVIFYPHRFITTLAAACRKHDSKRRSTAGCFSYGNVCGRTHVFGSRECFGCRSCSLQVSRILVINLDLNVLKYFCLIIDSFAALKIEARDFKYFIVHLQIHIGIDHGTPMVQLVLFQRTKWRYYFGTTIIIGNLMFVFLNLFFLHITKPPENFSFKWFHIPP